MAVAIVAGQTLSIRANRNKWRTVSWRRGRKGELKADVAAVRIRTADGPPQRIRDKAQYYLPGDKHSASGETRNCTFRIASFGVILSNVRQWQNLCDSRRSETRIH
jgi:hypothetical protein